ncbi:hypothetical protein Tco_1109310 [Tanacetum coccineum]
MYESMIRNHKKRDRRIVERGVSKALLVEDKEMTTTDLFRELNDFIILILRVEDSKKKGQSSQDLEVQVKMEMEIPRSSGVNFITACSYSTDTSKDLMKA